MKKYAFLVLFATAATAATAQQPHAALVAAPVAAPTASGYQALMTATINELQTAHTVGALKEAINKLDRAAAAAPADWLPRYYQGLGYVHLGAAGKDDAARDAYLDQAQTAVDKARRLVSNPGEVLVLQAYLYQTRLSVSPMMRGMEYGPKVSETLKEAKRVDPQNPRASFLMGSNLYYKPAMFGGGGEAAKPWLEQAASLFASARPANPLAPRWGHPEALEMLAQVKGGK